MRPVPKQFAGALAVMLMATPGSLNAEEVADASSVKMAELDPGLILTNSCDDEVNLALARERGMLLVDHQLLVSCWNARHNLAEVCPGMFPATSELLMNGPDRWFSLVYEALWREQLTPDAVIAENRRVVEAIELRVREASSVCLAEGVEGKALQKCQRQRVKASIQ